MEPVAGAEHLVPLNGYHRKIANDWWGGGMEGMRWTMRSSAYAESRIQRREEGGGLCNGSAIAPGRQSVRGRNRLSKYITHYYKSQTSCIIKQSPSSNRVDEGEKSGAWWVPRPRPYVYNASEPVKCRHPFLRYINIIVRVQCRERRVLQYYMFIYEWLGHFVVHGLISAHKSSLRSKTLADEEYKY